jgi:predicted nuclease with TOPRIM domain
MFTTKSASLLYTVFEMLTAYMGRAGLMLYAADLNDPDVKDAIKAAVEEATAGLTAKNAELLGEVKKLRKAGEIKPEDLERVEAERDELKTQLDKATKDLKTATTTAEKAAKQLEAAEGYNRTLLVDNGLNEALTKAGVTNPAFIKAARSILAGQVQIVTEGDQRVAKVGEKALGDFVGEWAKSDEGKHFVAAPGNSGGGAQGGSGDGGKKVEGKVDGTAEERAAYFASKYPELKST